MHAASTALAWYGWGLSDRVLGNQIFPLFGLFNPKRSILILKLRTLTAESRHGTRMCNHIHISASSLIGGAPNITR
jgi:hypothetical protein